MAITVRTQRVSPRGLGGPSGVGSSPDQFGAWEGSALDGLGRQIQYQSAELSRTWSRKRLEAQAQKEKAENPEPAVEEAAPDEDEPAEPKPEEEGVVNETARMMQAEAAREQEIKAFDSRYRESHQGRAALDAPSAYLDAVERINAKYRQGLTDNRVLAAYDSYAGQVRQRALGSALEYRRQQRNGWLSEAVDAERNRALQAQADDALDPLERQTTWQEYLAKRDFLYPGSGKARAEEDALAFQEAGQGKVRSDLLRQATADPQAALRAVGLSGETAKLDLAQWGKVEDIRPEIQQWFGPEDFLKLRSEVAGQVDNFYSSQMSDEAIRLKDVRTQVEQDLRARAGEGRLTPAELEAQQDLLSPEKYAKFIQAASGLAPGPAKSEPLTYLQLNRLALEGSPEFTAAAAEALQAGGLTISDYNALQEAAGQTPSLAGRQVEAELRRLIGFDEMNFDPEAATALLGALWDFDQWGRGEEGKKASDSQKLDKARAIAGFYRVASLDPAQLPLYLAGSRQAPDIDATLRETQRRFAAGQISIAEYEEQCVAIMRLDRLAGRQQETTGPGAPKERT